MGDDFDANKVAAEFINSNLDRIAKSFAASVKGAHARILANVGGKYGSYIASILEQNAKAKSFFIRSEPVPIYNFFVPPDLSNQHRHLRKPGASEVAAVARHAIITGLAGCGKSMLMKHFLISSVRSRKKTPILLELRRLNNGDLTLYDALLDTLHCNGFGIEEPYFTAALSAGHFSVLLDGFDELELRRRKVVTEQTHALVRQYPKNWFFISSRPEPELAGWNGFSVFSIAPLDLERAVELINKLPIDNAVKTKFSDELKAGLYEQHQSFLSNALLLSIMLLTYSDNANIPAKLSLFYDQAYESLFQKHDALKSGFQRERRTKLDIQDFGNVFAAFCVLSYDKRQFSFTRTQALELLDNAKGASGLNYKSKDFLNSSTVERQ